MQARKKIEREKFMCFVVCHLTVMEKLWFLSFFVQTVRIKSFKPFDFLTFLFGFNLNFMGGEYVNTMLLK